MKYTSIKKISLQIIIRTNLYKLAFYQVYGRCKIDWNYYTVWDDKFLFCEFFDKELKFMFVSCHFS